MKKLCLSTFALLTALATSNGFAATQLPLSELFNKAQSQTEAVITEITLEDGETQTYYRFTSFDIEAPKTLVLDVRDGSLVDNIVPEVDMAAAIDAAESAFSGDILSVRADLNELSELVYVIEIAQADSITIAEMDSINFRIVYTETLDEDDLEFEADHIEQLHY